MLKVNETIEIIITRVNDVSQKRLYEVERQRIKRIIEMRSMGPPSPWATSQIKEISREQRHNVSRNSPQHSRTPEATRQQQEQIRDLHRIVIRVQELDSRYRERVAISQQFFAEAIGFEEHDGGFDADD